MNLVFFFPHLLIWSAVIHLYSTKAKMLPSGRWVSEGWGLWKQCIKKELFEACKPRRPAGPQPIDASDWSGVCVCVFFTKSIHGADILEHQRFQHTNLTPPIIFFPLKHAHIWEGLLHAYDMKVERNVCFKGNKNIPKSSACTVFINR